MLLNKLNTFSSIKPFFEKILIDQYFSHYKEEINEFIITYNVNANSDDDEFINKLNSK